jgi:hypothetical protein
MTKGAAAAPSEGASTLAGEGRGGYFLVVFFAAAVFLAGAAFFIAPAFS